MNWDHVGRDNPPIMHVGNNAWEVVIGLEVHARVISKRKLFSGAPAIFLEEEGSQNRQVTLYDAAIPGTLPVLNKACLLQGIRAAHVLSGTINKEFFFERKHYFYPDLPSGYQISQLVKPIAVNGNLTIPRKDHNDTVDISIERIQMEQDAGKSLHDRIPEKTCIDLNRSGVCLLEIVSAPELHTVEEAQSYLKTLRSLLRYVGVCDGNMEQGSMRADVNVSLRLLGEPPGIRCEVKNLNSVRFMGQALRYEIQRQRHLLEKGERVEQETRSFNPSTGKTAIMRTKEDSRDYRYFTEPDLPVFQITDAFIQEACASLPEAQEERKKRFIKDDLLEEETARILCEEKTRADFFEEACKDIPSSCVKTLALWIVGDVLALCHGKVIAQTQLSPQNLAKMITLLDEGTLSGRMAKNLLPFMLNEGKSVQKLMVEMDVRQITDRTKLEAIVQDLIKTHPDKALAAKNKPALHGWFVGQVMQKTRGQAHPKMTAALVRTFLRL